MARGKLRRCLIVTVFVLCPLADSVHNLLTFVPMARPRWSLSGMLGTVLIFACASGLLAAGLHQGILLNPISVFVFTAALAGGLFVSVGARRVFWIGFGLAGWAFTGLIYEVPWLGDWYILALNRVFDRWGAVTWSQLGEPQAFIVMFFLICDSLVAVAIAVTGGWVSRTVFQKSDKNKTATINGSESH